jgi:DNA mismatch repair protein MutS
MTSELQQLQYGIESARKDIVQYEQALFEEIKREVTTHIAALRKSAHAIAHIDALLALGRLAYDHGYIRPEIHEQRDIVIVKGRHPVVEQSLMHTFIPNDTYLTDEQSLWIITGPNMGGKSTYLRQVALMCVMMHIGSFIPAKNASIALLDRIFTRLGANDNVAEGKSTFLVEMEETAMICTQATHKSLVILDEVGRGTSTFDGLAIAQAVVEYIYTTIGARCLFATHYHELTHLQQTYPGIAVYQAASKKTDCGILFLYTIMRGIADGSFGIEVAKLAHLPQEVIQRSSALVQSFAQGSSVPVIPAIKQGEAQGLLKENRSLKAENKRLLVEQNKAEKMLNMFQEIDFDSLSPKKAFDLLWEYKNG